MSEHIGGKHILVYEKTTLLAMILSVTEALMGRQCRIKEAALLLGTAAVESDMRHRVQIGGGPARGLFQMEPGMTGALDIFVNYLIYQNTQHRQELWHNLTSIWLGLDSVPYFTPSEEDLEYHLEHNDPFACAMARAKYLRVKAAIPKTVAGLASYWKSFYNSILGKGTVEKFMEAWKHHECNDLLEYRFGSVIPMNSEED